MEIILPHLAADFDALASAVAAWRLYPQARIVFPGSQERNVRDYLSRHPGRIPWMKARQVWREPVTRIILVDVSGPDRVGDLARLLQQPGIEIIRYDHHATRLPIAGEKSVYRPYGANATVMVEALREQGQAPSPFEATLYLLGIYEETGNLTYTSTTPEDLEAAAYLLRQGANVHEVTETIKHRLTAEQQGLFDDLIKSRQTLRINGVEISLATAERDHFIEELSSLATRLFELENLQVLFILVRMNRHVHLVARGQTPELDLSQIVAQLGGGGHPTAASAVIKSQSVTAVRSRLLRVLADQVRPVKTARDIMSAPVITVPPDATVGEAHRIMLRFGHSGLAVVGPSGFCGIITQQNLSKALHHGLQDSMVRHYMTTRLILAKPEDPVPDIRRRMLNSQIRHLPVVDHGELCGIVTRQDILRAWVENGTPEPARLLPASLRLDAVEAEGDDLRGLLRERLPERVLVLLHTAGEIADELGLPAYGVGGFVRDLFLKTENMDLDIVVEGDALAYARALALRLNGQVRTHPRFGTALVTLADGFKLDVATARTEYYAQPAALPQVESSSIKYDLFRRDFSINAMAIRINPAYFGQLVDYYNGRHDLRQGWIRVLYPTSFVDDPTRVFRALRFEQRYQFALEPDTENYLRHAVALQVGQRLSSPRVLDELMLIFCEWQPENILRRMGELGALAWIPGAQPSAEEAVRFFNSLWEAFAFSILYLDEPVDRRLIYLMAFYDHLSLAQAESMATAGQLPRRATTALLAQKKHGDSIRERLATSKALKPSQIDAGLNGLPLEVLLYEMARASGTPADKRIRDYLVRWRRIRPLLAGKDLTKMGFVPGPQFVTMLKSLRAARLNGQVMSRQDEMNWIRKHFQSPKNN